MSQSSESETVNTSPITVSFTGNAIRVSQFVHMELFYISSINVRSAIAVWQLNKYRQSLLPGRFIWSFSSAGAAGALLGTWFLATLPQSTLSLVVAAGVFGFIIFRLARSNWVLAYNTALKICIPVGLVAGTMQGASGISAPVSLSFFSAMQLERKAFVSSISVYFIAMTLIQIPALMSLGIMKPRHFLIGSIAMIPIILFMFIGQQLMERFSRNTFDRIMLLLLFFLAIKLVIDNI